MLDLLLKALVVLLVCFLIITYLIPMLPAPFGAIVMVVLVVAVIIWLLKSAGLWF